MRVPRRLLCAPFDLLSLSLCAGKKEEAAKPEEYYHYHLAGVVVHMGTANSGHYYSYIRPRDGGGEWLEFNDTVVSTFDVEVRCEQRERVWWFIWPDADRRVWLFHAWHSL